MSWEKISACMLISCALQAAVIREIDEKKALEATFSRLSHNRICVEGGVVEKVVGDSSLFSVTLDKSTGQAFINVLQDVIRPTTLTVITNSGCVQDLLILAKDCPSEQIILKEADDNDWDETVQGAAIVDMLNKILEGKVPLGYGQRPIENEISFDLPKPLTAEPLKVLEGALETIVVYRIKNESHQTVVITSDSLKKEAHSWLFLNVHNLEREQEALCIIATAKNRN